MSDRVGYIPPERMAEWEQDCLKWRGEMLTGQFSHWCFDWDGLPVDETTREWPCGCGLVVMDGTNEA